LKTVALDSDVILDALLYRSPLDIPALNILNMGYQGKLKLFTSPVAFVNVHYFLNKFARENKMELLTGLRKVVNISKVDETIIDLALNSNFTDFEDAVQHYAARATGVQVIITRNLKDYKNADIPVLTPEQFLKTL
jgi:predicted nucleic acid-binding protein